MNEDEIAAVIAAAKARGRVRIRQMIEEAGGLLSTAEAAVAAGMTEKQLQKSSLLAIETEGEIGWPRFQFESQAMMDGVSRVVGCIGVDSGQMRLAFFLMRLDELGGMRPIDAIRAGNLRAIELAAYHFGRHGAS